jgi:hypothetical protein
MIYLMRHFKVKDTKQYWMNSTQFEQWVRDYDAFALHEKIINLPSLNKVYTSTCRRVIRTADSLACTYQTSDLLVEVDAKAFMQTPLPLPKWLWLTTVVFKCVKG